MPSEVTNFRMTKDALMKFEMDLPADEFRRTDKGEGKVRRRPVTPELAREVKERNRNARCLKCYRLFGDQSEEEVLACIKEPTAHR
jgi:hypothetical protein